MSWVCSRPTSSVKVFLCSYHPVSLLENLIRKHFGIQRLSELPGPRTFVVSGTDSGSTLWPSYQLDLDVSVVRPKEGDLTLNDAALATSAAPTFLPPHQVDDKLHLDGGFGYNNPSHLALVEAGKLWPDRNVGVFLSLGLGDCPVTIPSDRCLIQSWRDALTATATETEKTHSSVQNFFHSRLRHSHYARLSFPIGHLPLDTPDERDFAKIRTLTEQHVESLHSDQQWRALIRRLAVSFMCNYLVGHCR